MHRFPRLVLIALVATALVPAPVQGQDNGYRIDDRVGDGQVKAGPGDPIGDGSTPAADMLAFRIEEEPGSFRFLIDGSQGMVAGVDTWIYAIIDFSSGGQAYRVKFPPDEPGVPGAGLYRVDPAGGARLVDAVPVIDSLGPETMGFTVSSDLVLDGYGAIPGPGSILNGFKVTVTSAQYRVGPAPFYTVDTLPDPGVEVKDYVVRYGLEQLGLAKLTSLRPVRASNGEEATFVFAVTAQNLGDQPGTFSLTWDGAPASWRISTARPVFEIPGKSAVPVNLVVSVPFAHQHGSFDSVRLKMTQASNPESLGQVNLGIRYHEVPQPAGHHARLTFHSTQNPDTLPVYTDVMGGASFAYMNSLSEDPESDEVPVVANANVRPITNTTWTLRLAPSLAIGLQLDPTGTGHLLAPIQSPLPIASATLEANLYLFGSIDGVLQRTVILTGESAPNPMLTPDQPVNFEVDLQSDGQRYPFTPGSELMLELRLKSEREASATAAELPELLPGGYVDLPLLEFRDAIEDVVVGPQGFSLEALSAIQRIGNPGDAFLFQAKLTNLGVSDTTYALRLEGANVGWAQIGFSPVKVQAGESLDIPVIVRIPQDASALQVSDILLIANPVGDAGNEGILRLLTEVDKDTDRPDDSAILPTIKDNESTEAPSISLGILLAGIALAMSWRAKFRFD